MTLVSKCVKMTLVSKCVKTYFLFKVTIFAPKQLKTYLFGSDSDGGVRPFSGQSDRGQKQKGEASHDFVLMGTALTRILSRPFYSP